MQMLGSREGMGGGSAGADFETEEPAPRAAARPAARPATSKPAPNIAEMDDDIPF
jgi:single-strand DNA-binding protein